MYILYYLETENVKEPLEELLPPESDKMRQLCSLLNKSNLGVIKCWKELAYEWGIPRKIYRVFDPTEKASPTIFLLEWVKTTPNDTIATLTVGQLCEHLKKIDRYDVINDVLQEKLKKQCGTSKS